MSAHSTSAAGRDSSGARIFDKGTARIIHRPKTREQMVEAAAELARSGFSDYGISHALQLSVEQVRQMLGEWRERCE